MSWNLQNCSQNVQMFCQILRILSDTTRHLRMSNYHTTVIFDDICNLVSNLDETDHRLTEEKKLASEVNKTLRCKLTLSYKLSKYLAYRKYLLLLWKSLALLNYNMKKVMCSTISCVNWKTWKRMLTFCFMPYHYTITLIYFML